MIKRILKEDQESDSQKKAIELYIKNNDCDKEEATNFIRKKLRAIFPILNGNKKAGKFTLGIYRLMYECDSNIGEHSLDFKEKFKDGIELIIKTITRDESLYVSLDKNLNGLSYKTLFDKCYCYMKYRFEEIENEKEEKREQNPTDYKIEEINSFEDAQKFSKYVSWCITKSKDMYNRYTENGRNKLYFLLKKGFENVEKKDNSSAPFDEYGLSMIAISITNGGELNTSTSRWNHDINGYGDHFASLSALKNYTNLNLNELCKNSATIRSLYATNPKLVKCMRNFGEGFDKNMVKKYSDLLIIKHEIEMYTQYTDTTGYEKITKNDLFFNESYSRECDTINVGFFYTLFIKRLNDGYIFSLPSLEIKPDEIVMPKNEDKVICIKEIDGVPENDYKMYYPSCKYYSNLVIFYDDEGNVSQIIYKDGKIIDKYKNIRNLYEIFPSIDTGADEEYRPSSFGFESDEGVFLVDQFFDQILDIKKDIKFNLSGKEFQKCSFVDIKGHEGDVEPTEFIYFKFMGEGGEKCYVVYDRYRQWVINKSFAITDFEVPTYNMFIGKIANNKKYFAYNYLRGTFYEFGGSKTFDDYTYIDNLILFHNDNKYFVYTYYMGSSNYIGCYAGYKTLENVYKDHLATFCVILKQEDGNYTIYNSYSQKSLSGIEKIYAMYDDIKFIGTEFGMLGYNLIQEYLNNVKFIVKKSNDVFKMTCYGIQFNRIFGINNDERKDIVERCSRKMKELNF